MVGLLCGIPIHADVRHDRAPFQHWLHFAKRNVPGDRANIFMPMYSCQYDDDVDVDSLSELKLDQVLLPVDNLDNAKPVDLSDVAGLEPSVKEN